MAETAQQTRERLTSELADRKRQGRALRVRLSAVRARIRRLTDGIRRRELPKRGLWHPHATRVPYADAGPFMAVPGKLVWHTTEGTGLPVYSGSAPHFTFDPRSGRLWQHIPVNRSALSLEHPAGTVETNHAHALQVELIGFARDTGGWPPTFYSRIARLARWIEASAGVSRRCALTFSNTPKRLASSDWLNYSGHCGHQHVPSQSHWDPGSFRIREVL